MVDLEEIERQALETDALSADNSQRVINSGTSYVGSLLYQMRTSGHVEEVGLAPARPGIEPELPDDVSIYGIRDKKTGEIRYVGATTQTFKARRASGYAALVEAWLASTDWEYVLLERAPREIAVDRETFHIARLVAEGCHLLNKDKPFKTRRYDEEHDQGGPPKWRGIVLREERDGQLASWRAAAEAADLDVRDWAKLALDREAAAKEPGE